jgi:hypothetical protein
VFGEIVWIEVALLVGCASKDLGGCGACVAALLPKPLNQSGQSHLLQIEVAPC